MTNHLASVFHVRCNTMRYRCDLCLKITFHRNPFSTIEECIRSPLDIKVVCSPHKDCALCPPNPSLSYYNDLLRNFTEIRQKTPVCYNIQFKRKFRLSKHFQNVTSYSESTIIMSAYNAESELQLLSPSLLGLHICNKPWD